MFGASVQNGDLSNKVTPRVLLVFEGSLGFIDGARMDHFDAYATKGDWHEAWCQWEINKLLARRLWDIQARQGTRVSIVTYIHDTEECARGLEELMEDLNLPTQDVTATDPWKLSREIAYMPDVVRIYDANSETAFMYGQKGHHLKNWLDVGKLLCNSLPA